MTAPFHQIRPEAASIVQQSGAIAPPLEKRRLMLYALQMVVDACLLFNAHALASWVYAGHPWDSHMMLMGQMMAFLFITIALYSSAYSQVTLTNWQIGARRMLWALLVSAVLLNTIAFYTKSNAEFSRGAVTIGLLISIVMMVGGRFLLGQWIRRTFGSTLVNVLVIDDGGPAFKLPHAYHISAEEHGLLPSLSDPYGLDRLGGYMRNMDRVIVTAPFERRQEWSLMLKGSGVNGEVICSVVRQLGALGVHHYDDVGQSALLVATGPLGLRARAGKRLFDIAFSGAGLVLLSPLLLIAAVLVKLQDGGPVLFRQKRMGRGNRFFTMYKFRTMQVHQADPDGHRSASRDDDRITPIGRVLRCTSIDELPQLINVLSGQMSIVGPRPHAIGSHAGDKCFWEIDRRYWQRHSLKPGLTGLAQVRGLRGATPQESDLQQRLRSDLEYLNGWSIWRDCYIVMMTLRVLVHERAF